MEPAAVLAAWSGGVALVAAMVTSWAIVGPGFTWLSVGVAVMLAVPAALAGSSVLPWIGGGMLLAAAVLARRRPAAVTLAATAGVVMLAAASAADEPPLLVVTAAVVLGGVTGEMLLGHWYLVDPRLPRSALRRLCLIGLGGALADPVTAVLLGAPGAGSDAVVVTGWVVLAVTSAALMAAVWSALGERGYPAVMAATGLSYLAVLTVIGLVVLGRVLVAGEVL
ncbi:MAG TPA: hypothetical protein VFY15_02165 [Acidimicrobiia bacterium]|nr:hypothetical protein [Acidimicrobiia bacterium]